MSPLTAESDLQSLQTWNTMFDYLLNRPHGGVPESLILYPDFQTYKDTLRKGMDIQTQGTTSTIFGQPEYIISLSGIITAVSGPANFTTNLSLGDAFGVPIKNKWIHIKEPNWWGRVSDSTPILNASPVKLDYGPRKYDGTRVPLQVGWHVDYYRAFNYSIRGLYGLVLAMKQFRGEPIIDPVTEELLFRLRRFGPRCIKEVTDRFWYSNPKIIVSGGQHRPAIAGMRAIRPHGRIVPIPVGLTTNNVVMGPWTQDLNVYEFQGKKWIPKTYVHGKEVSPDVLDSESPNPNFQYYQTQSPPDSSKDERAYQQYFTYQTFNSILELN